MLGWVSAATQSREQGGEPSGGAGRGRTRRGCGGRSISSDFREGKAPSRRHTGLPGAQVCCDHQLLDPPRHRLTIPTSRLDRQTDRQTEAKQRRGITRQKSIPAGREKRRGRTYRGGAGRGGAAVPLSPARLCERSPPSAGRFYGRIRADVRGEPRRAPSRGISPPRCPLSSNQHRDFHESEGTRVLSVAG